jgi:plastocyanin
MSQKNKWAFTFLLFLLCVMTSVMGFGEMNHSPVTINMESWAPYYRPFEAAISPQAPIQWNNPTASPHTVQHDGCAHEGPCLFDSGAVPPDGSYTIPGLTPGRYFYHCELHPIMRGELIVNGQGADLPLELASIAKRTKD